MDCEWKFLSRAGSLALLPVSSSTQATQHPQSGCWWRRAKWLDSDGAQGFPPSSSGSMEALMKQILDGNNRIEFKVDGPGTRVTARGRRMTYQRGWTAPVNGCCDSRQRWWIFAAGKIPRCRLHHHPRRRRVRGRLRLHYDDCGWPRRDGRVDYILHWLPAQQGQFRNQEICRGHSAPDAVPKTRGGN